MKKVWLVLVGVAALSLCCAPAFADEILLGKAGSATNSSVIFTSNGKPLFGFSVAFQSNAAGSAFGTGSLSEPNNNKYSVLQNGATVRTDGVNCGSGCYQLTQNAPLTFNYGTGCATLASTCWLTGNLFLTDVTQSGNAGVFNDSLLVNLIVTGGQLATTFGVNGIVQFTLHFQSTTDLIALFTSKTAGTTLGGYITSGAVFKASEPSTLPLLGSTLLAFVGLAWKNKLFAV